MTQPYPQVHYPELDQITPHGWFFQTHGDQPTMRLKAFDGSIDFFIAGGRSIPDRFNAPERVSLPRDGLKGLIAPWKHIDQKGAVQDGVSQLDALYDPIEVGLEVMCHGRDGKHLHRVVRDLIASLDAKQTSEFGFLSHDEGYWWSNVRWFQGAPQNPVSLGGQRKTQRIPLRLRADNGFWRSYATTDQWGFTYESLVENFSYVNGTDLGANWPQTFYEADPLADGVMFADGKNAKWGTRLRLGARSSIALRKGFTTTTDYQVLNMYTDRIPATWYQKNCNNDIWGRCNVDASGNWLGDGIRMRVGMQAWNGWVELTCFKNFVPVWKRGVGLFVPPWFGDRWTLILGDEGSPRLFRVQRNGATVLQFKEPGTNSVMDSAHRAVGLGMRAGRAWPELPANVGKFTAGDNSTVAQNGFVRLVNVGDQPMHYELTLFGPFSTCKVWNGPNAGEGEYVTFGPLGANQSVVLRTDPKVRPLVELPSSTPLTQNAYKLLRGRFSDAAAIPAKSPGSRAKPYFVKVQIDDGNADSKVLVSGIPLRRYPL